MPHWPWRSAARRSSATRFASGSSWAAAPWSARATTSWPHESNYSRDGSLIYHASIGPVYTPADAPVLDATKGDRWFQVVDARTLRVLRRIDVGKASRRPATPA